MAAVRAATEHWIADAGVGLLQSGSARSPATPDRLTHTNPGKENAMFALLKDVPPAAHPVFRVLLGAALMPVGLLLHHGTSSPRSAARCWAWAFHGVAALAGDTQKRQLR
jgi:hypothetical protein